MNRIASHRITDASLETLAGIGKCRAASALYAIWPGTFAGSHLVYAIALAAARQRVEQLQQRAVAEPNMN